MSENPILWWKKTKRRAYTYKEKKWNRLSDYDLYLEMCGVEVEGRSINEILAKNGVGKISERKLIKIKANLEDKINKDNFKKIIEEDDIINPFTFTTTIRDHALYKPTTSESYCIYVHYIYQTLLRTLENSKQAPEKNIEKDVWDPVLYDGVLLGMHDNWKLYMDNVSLLESKINKLVS